MGNQMLLGVLCLFSIASVLLIRPSLTIEVTPNSHCSSLCLNEPTSNPEFDNSSLTLTNGVVCSDAEYVGFAQTPPGRKWNDCLSCEQNSAATDAKTKQNDLYWLLFNMKFVIDWCVFAYPDNAHAPPAQAACSKVCAGPNNSIKISLTDRLLEANTTLQYLYCDGPNILDIFDDCVTCLNNVPDAQVLGQYVKTLRAACVQKPDVGQTVKLDFDLFPTATSLVSSTKTESNINIESATITSTSPDPAMSILVASLQASFSAEAASESAASASKASHDSNVRTNVGIGVGVGIGGFLAISTAVCIIWTLSRSARRKKIAEENARTHPEMEYQANSIVQDKFFGHQQVELANGSNLVEVDGQTNRVFMLDGSTIHEVPGHSSAVTTTTTTTTTTKTATA